MPDDPTPTADVLSALTSLPDLIGDDDALRTHLTSRVTGLIDTVFDEIEDIFDAGDPATKTTIIKMILPLVIKIREKSEVRSDEVEEAKAEMRAMLAEMGAGLGSYDPPAPDDDVLVPLAGDEVPDA
jgi:HAMP domain-containing protein